VIPSPRATENQGSAKAVVPGERLPAVRAIGYLMDDPERTMTNLIRRLWGSRAKETGVIALGLPAAALLVACGAEPSASPEPGFGTGAGPSGSGGDSTSSGGAASSTGGASSGNGNGGLASGNGGAFPSGAGGSGLTSGSGGSTFGTGGVQSTGNGGLFGSGGGAGAGGRNETGGEAATGGSRGNGGAGSGGAATDGGLPASCTNGVRDGTETDVDCGGGVCPKCADGMNCSRRSDCISNNCEGLGQRTCGNQ
jgi:hypothetical protein